MTNSICIAERICIAGITTSTILLHWIFFGGLRVGEVPQVLSCHLLVGLRDILCKSIVLVLIAFMHHKSLFQGESALQI